MAVAKACAAPEGGGSAHRALLYILHHRTTEGPGQHPAKVVAFNVGSVLTAAIEMDAYAVANGRVKSPVRHDIVAFSPTESSTLSYDVMIAAARRMMVGLGDEEHPAVYSLHTDQDHFHVHIVTSTVNPMTLRVPERRLEHERMAKGMRQAEIDFGLEHGRGAYVIRVGDDGEKRIVRATVAEKRSWRITEREERLDALVRSFVSETQGMESYEHRRDRLVFKIRSYLEECGTRGKTLLRADVHRLAAQEGCRILDPALPEGALIPAVAPKGLVIEMLERLPRSTKYVTDDFGDQQEIRLARTRGTGLLYEMPFRDLAPGPYGVSLAEPASETRYERARREAAIGWRKWLSELGNVERSEREVVAEIRRDPGRISRDLTEHEALLDASDFDRWVGERVTGPDLVASLSDYAQRKDQNLQMLTERGEHGMFTTKTQLRLEQDVHDLALELCQERDPLFSREKLDAAIAAEEASNGWKFDAQQLRLFEGLQYRFSVANGDSGSGKSSSAAVMRRYAAMIGRPISGLATSQMAAEKLSSSSGIKTKNTARALALEASGGERMVPQGGISILDESSMVSLEATLAYLKRIRSNEAIGMATGDAAQLPNISAGDTMRVLTLAAKKAGRFTLVKAVYRQKDGSDVGWMRKAVPYGGRAIREADPVAARKYFGEYIRRGHVRFHETLHDEVMAKAAEIVACARLGRKAIALGYAHRECHYANLEVRRELGLEGKGKPFRLARGVRELAPGDRVVFTKNAEKRFGVLNGYTGTVLSLRPGRGSGWFLEVQLDGGRVVKLDPSKYHHLDYGWVVNTHRAQGQGDPQCIASIGLRDTARSAHVALTRGTENLSVHCTIPKRMRADGTAAPRDPEKVLLDHLCSREALAPKSDALLYRELEMKFGGRDTAWARAMRRAQAHYRDPLRVEHRAWSTQRRVTYLLEAEALKKRGLKGTKKEAAIRSLLDQYEPVSFVRWAAQNRTRVESVPPPPDPKRATVRDLPYKSRVWERFEEEPRRRPSPPPL